MATTALHKRKPSHDHHHEEAEKNPNACRAVVVKSSSNINGPQPPKATTTTTTTMSSYFFSITIPQPTIRIRIPRLLAKTLQRRTIHHGYSDGDDHGDDDDDHHQTNKTTKKKKRKAWPRPKKHLAKTVGSLISNVFGKRNPPTYSKVNESNDGGGVEVEILDTGESDDDKPLAVAPESPSFKTFAFEREDGKERTKKKARKTSMAGKPRKRSHSFTRFLFYNPTSLNSTRSNQMDGATNVGCGCIIGKRGIIADMPDANGPVIRINPVALPVHDFASKPGFGSVRQQTDNNLPGIRIVRPRLKMVRSMRKKPKRQNADDAELCKKRILMGGKCKPLHSLKYDSDGILLPELNL